MINSKYFNVSNINDKIISLESKYKKITITYLDYTFFIAIKDKI